MARKAKVSQAVEGISEHDGQPIIYEGTVIHVFSLGRDIGCISVSAFREKKALDIRRFYLDDEEQWRPTSKGIRIPAEVATKFMDALTEQRDDVLALLK